MKALRLSFLLIVAAIFWFQNAAGQHPAVPKLTQVQVEQFVSNKVPDSTLSTQIQRRGLAFAPSQAVLDSLRAKGAGPLTLGAIEALIPIGTQSAGTSRAASGYNMQPGQFSGASVTLSSGLSSPAGLAVDGSGNVFVADQNPPGIKEILAAGGYLTVNQLGNASFAALYGVAEDGSGNLFVTETGRGLVKEILAAGGYTTVNTLPVQGTRGNPWGLAVDGRGNVFVAYQGWVGEVKEVPSGCASASCVKVLGGGFGGPRGIAVDERRNVFIADADANAVKKIPPGCVSAQCVQTAGGGFTHPQGVAVDENGNVFVTDTGNNAVKEIPPGCDSASCVKTLGNGFNAPWGVAVDKAGDVLVVDAGNHRVVGLEAVGSKLSQAVSDPLKALETPDCTEGEQTVSKNAQLVFVLSPLRECWTPWLAIEGNFINFHESGNLLLQFGFRDGTTGDVFEDGPKLSFNEHKPIKKVRFKSLRKEPVTISMGHQW